MRQKFYDVATVWNLSKKDIKKYYGSWEYFYEQFKKGNVPIAPQEYSDITVCGLWIKSGCPYYKIYPGIIDKFLQTRIDIDSSLLRLPHKCFAIRIPESENPILSWKDEGRLFYIKSILVLGMKR